MLDPVIAFFQRVFAAFGRGVGLVVAWLLWPFMAAHGWYQRRNWLIKGPIILVLLVLVIFYGLLFWRTQVWYGFNPEMASGYNLNERTVAAGEPVAGQAGVCQNSAIVTLAADLTDMNVNQNVWISSTLLYKTGLFGMDWDNTPFFDNKASFQRGVNQVVRRVGIELADNLGRVRGTSGINNDLQDARGNIQFDEGTWYFGTNPFGFKTPTPSFYRAAVNSWRKFNSDLELCNAVFDARADNLMQLLDRMASDLGNTSDILRRRSEEYNAGWFDTRADDRFWFAYGQLYAQYAILQAAKADFRDVIRERNLTSIWVEMEKQLQASLRIQPAIISNGSEDGWIMPTHLATMGFYILRVRSNMVELRAVLDR
ncbi:DUF2333 family protein [Ciceribacter sp. L1K23]|uniref:DUF2333 family protein n=1 Tax=unclassified Ciceribacter TaxID=2628820 RepID=UPI001ABEE07D|nr:MULTISPECIES: DUF2333 family protein [unclassified Ciceribacter]MBO3761127.1 DUF2333 family protein [Ciceribacter sp. L1K22]MBR0554640.1 DUF2333 family protein [Ciceribacter sp. L1K23]